MLTIVKAGPEIGFKLLDSFKPTEETWTWLRYFGSISSGEIRMGILV
jgi:hypothetical protein